MLHLKTVWKLKPGDSNLQLLLTIIDPIQTQSIDTYFGYSGYRLPCTKTAKTVGTGGTMVQVPVLVTGLLNKDTPELNSILEQLHMNNR